MEKNLIFESSSSRTYLLKGSPYGEKVLLKEQKPVRNAVQRLVQQYELLKDLRVPGISRVLAFDDAALEPSMVLEYAEGDSIRMHLEQGKLPLSDFFTIALSLCDTLVALHRAGILHKDLSPNNIIWDPITRSTTLIDFGFAASIKQKNRSSSAADRMEGTLAYMSPEQTGRVNRDVDFRSDLYSLGAIFYEMLAGTPLFAETDPNALVYAQIARIPTPLATLNPDLPAHLADVVMRLLEKDATCRYQSASGLRHDLAWIAELFQGTHTKEVFVPGQRDFSASLQFSQKLYGREAALKDLQDEFEAVCKGANRLVLVEGASGTGKSALANELNKSFIERNSLFIAGKFDQYRRDTPYLAWTQAFEQLIAYILTGSDAELEGWKQHFAETLGDNGQALAELIPSLHLVTGAQPPAEKLGGAEAQNRFNFLFETFLKAVCRAECPLVIFLDDLQWADYASRQMLQATAGNSSIRHLMLIAAHRPAEEDPTSGLKPTLKALKALAAPPLSLKLEGLQREQIEAWLSDTLQPCPRDTLKQLTEAVFEKTWGNAFFTKRFVQSLYDQELLYFEHDQSKWAIRAAEIGRMQMTDNVVEFMAQKIVALNPQSVHALKTAAVIGNEFDHQLLQDLLGTEVLLERVLQAPLSEGFIELVQEEADNLRYAFTHDRIYQAAGEMNDPAQTKAIHHQIALQLLEKIPPEQWHDHAFLMVSHLNPAAELLREPAQREALVGINLMAGRRAKASNAYEQAVRFLETGLAFCTDDEQRHAILCELLESYYLKGQFDRSEACAAQLRAMSLAHAQRLQALQLELRLHKAKSNYPAAIRTGLEALRLVGERLPENPGKLDVLRSFISTQIALRKKTPDVLLNLPPVRDENKLAAMQIMSELGLAAYLTNQNLLPVMTFKAVQLAARYGNSQYTPSDYNVFGFVLGQMGNLKNMRAFAEMSKELADRLDISPSMRAKYLLTYNCLTRHWFEHPALTLPGLQQAYHLGRDSGDLDALVNALMLQLDFSLIHGAPVGELAELAENGLQLCERLDQKIGYYYFKWTSEFLAALREPGKTFDFSFEAEEAAFLERSDSNGLCKMAIYRALLCLISGDYTAGLAMLECTKKYPMSNSGLLIDAWIPFLKGLLAARILNTDPKNALARRVWGSARKKTAQYAAFNPDSFGHRKLYFEAMDLFLAGKKTDAARLIKQSESEAAKHKFPLDQALLLWETARLYQKDEQAEHANAQAASAWHLFNLLQFDIALKQIEQGFPNAVFTEESTSDSGSRSGSSGAANLDLATVIKTLQSISSEVVFDKLVHNLLRLVAENAGAEKGFLLLDKKAEWLAAHNPASEALQLLPLASVDQYRERLATQIAQYCLRTGESVVLDTAHSSEKFAADPYIAAARPRSLMCMPLKNQGKITGLLYLENNLIDGAFKNERGELLRLLSAQLAGSIENAYLYENLEQSVLERTQQLEEEKQQSERLLLNILPAKVAQELKTKGSSEPTQFDLVTVLFTDFVNFTSVSEQLPPKELVGKLDTCFRAFDEIVERHGLEKIKTVGDAYIAVCGLPVADPQHGIKTVRAALDIQAFIREFSRKEHIFEIRIGIHSGPVVAGIVGSKKFQYDIWGDTVNTAARMEQHSQPGKINISYATYHLVNEYFACEHRGKIPAKNKGEVDMYFVG